MRFPIGVGQNHKAIQLFFWDLDKRFSLQHGVLRTSHQASEVYASIFEHGCLWHTLNHERHNLGSYFFLKVISDPRFLLFI